MSRAATLVLAVSALGCAGAKPLDYEAAPGPYDRFEATDLERVRAARRSEELGDAYTASAIWDGLVARLPENIQLAVLRQEFAIRRQLDAEGKPDPRALDALRRSARADAERLPSVPNLVLAARLEPDPIVADRYLARATEADPACIWAWYGRAHLAAGRREYAEATRHLERALELDPGHLPTRLLEATLLVGAGEYDQGAYALEAWLERAEGDPRVDPSQVERARTNLAIAYAYRGDLGDARDALDLLGEDDAVVLAVRAAVESAGGDSEEALAAAVRAAAVDPDDPLPEVHQAWLQQFWLEDEPAALAAWRRVLERLERAGERSAGGELDLGQLRLAVEARVRVERLSEKLGRDAAP